MCGRSGDDQVYDRGLTMRIHVYGVPRDIDGGFDDHLDPVKTAVV
jgi:hypothetical protein